MMLSVMEGWTEGERKVEEVRVMIKCECVLMKFENWKFQMKIFNFKSKGYLRFEF